MQSTVRNRLVKGIGAAALGPVITSLTQLISVPIFLHCWGGPKYGDWLMISALPWYLGLSDLGFGSAAGSDMTMRVAAGDREGALETFQSVWVFTTALSLVPFVIVCVCGWSVPWTRVLKLTTISQSQTALVMLLLCAYILLIIQSTLLDSGFRADGNYAFGAVLLNIVRFLELAAATATTIFGGGLVCAAVAYLGTRTVGVAALMVLLRRRSPWIHWGFSKAKIECVRKLAPPALAFMAFPIAYALSFQGMIILVGATLGSIAVVSFTTLRTLSRAGYQLFTVIAHAIRPEISAAIGVRNTGLACRLHRRACQAALAISLASSVFLALLGPVIYGLWTRHAVTFDAVTYNILLLVMVVSSLWFTSCAVSMATNRHQLIALAYAVGTLASLGLAYILMKSFGIRGGATALLCIEAVMTCLVVPRVLSQLHDTIGSFVAAMFTLPDLRLASLLKTERTQSKAL